MVGDFTGHQVELLQTSALLGDDFHAPAARGGIMHESRYRRSPGGAVSPVKTRGGRLPAVNRSDAHVRGAVTVPAPPSASFKARIND